jgi:hypothetical protein
MPEKKFRNKLIDYVNPQENENIRGWFWNRAKYHQSKTALS